MGRKRRAGDRFTPSSYEEDVARQTEHRWDTPRKRALFGSDEPDIMTSGSDFVEISDFHVTVIPWELNPGCSLRMILPKQRGPQVRSEKMQ